MEINILKKMLYSLTATFLLIVAFFVLPFSDSIRIILFPVVGILGLVFLILGIVLIFVARKKKKSKLKTFLLITGLSAIAPLPLSILHNVFYALGMLWPSLEIVFEFLSGASFIIALLVAPITFLISVIGSLVLIKK